MQWQPGCRSVIRVPPPQTNNKDKATQGWPNNQKNRGQRGNFEWRRLNSRSRLSTSSEPLSQKPSTLSRRSRENEANAEGGHDEPYSQSPIWSLLFAGNSGVNWAKHTSRGTSKKAAKERKKMGKGSGKEKEKETERTRTWLSGQFSLASFVTPSISSTVAMRSPEVLRTSSLMLLEISESETSEKGPRPPMIAKDEKTASVIVFELNAGSRIVRFEFRNGGDGMMA
ncbi:13844_t:CDS:1 [Acaulospora colombiana]|uniref:13844_t:CDS:1 n=1 Tax=Acaulospora colombiana TaxID=27376 RepID=A0ACA9NG76_9GLOM|nr:13844_t:CDS:1 [Acaulospora colombiana]